MESLEDEIVQSLLNALFIGFGGLEKYCSLATFEYLVYLRTQNLRYLYTGHLKKTKSVRLLGKNPCKIQRFAFRREFLINGVGVGFKFPRHIPTILRHHLGNEEA